MAAERKIETTLAIGGEKVFNAAIADSTRSLKIMASELKLNTAEFNLNGSSIENLTKRRDILSKEMDQEREHILALTQAVADSSQRYGENSANTDKYKESLVKAQTALTVMEKELGDNQTAIDTYGQKVDETSKKTIDWKNVLSEVNTSLDKNIQGYTAALAAIGAFIGGVIAAGTQVFNATVEMGKFADGLITTSMQTGISTQSLQQWTYAAQFIDTEVETMTGSMAKMIRSMASAQQGTEQSVLAFAALGVNITDSSGKLLDSEAVFFSAIDALGKIANETERDALAMQIFGKSAQELNPLIMAGSAQLRALGIEAQTLGVVMSDSTVTAFGAFDDSMNVVNGTIQSVKNNFLIAMLPAMNTITSVVQGMATKFNEWLKTDGAQALLATLTKKISDLATNLGDNLTPIVEGVIGAFDTIIKTVGWVIDNIGLLKTIAIGLAGTLVTLKVAQIAVNLAMATNPIGAIITVIGLCVMAIIGLVQNWDAVKTTVSNVWESIKSAFSAGVSAVTGFIGDIIASFGRMVSGAWDAGKNLVSGIWKGIQSTANWLSDQITGWLSGMWKGIRDFFGIKSPSSLMAETVGKPMVQGMVLGITKNAGLMDKALAGLVPSSLNSSVLMDVSRRFNDYSGSALSGRSAGSRLAAAGRSVLTSREEFTQAVAAGVKAALREQGETVLIMNDREFGRAVRKVALA